MLTKKNQNKIVNMFMILAIVVVIHLGVDMVVNITTLRYLQEFEDLEYYQNEIPLENATAEYVDYVREIFKYNISNAGKELSREQLLDQGGVCSHYAKLYIDLAKKDGFNGEYVVFDVGNIGSDITAHAVAIISNNKGYCVLDQTNGWCSRFNLESINETNN